MLITGDRDTETHAHWNQAWNSPTPEYEGLEYQLNELGEPVIPDYILQGTWIDSCYNLKIKKLARITGYLTCSTWHTILTLKPLNNMLYPHRLCGLEILKRWRIVSLGQISSKLAKKTTLALTCSLGQGSSGSNLIDDPTKGAPRQQQVVSLENQNTSSLSKLSRWPILIDFCSIDRLISKYKWLLRINVTSPH